MPDAYSQTHMYKENARNKNHLCDYPGCSKSFVQRQHLLRHQTQKHGREGRRRTYYSSSFFETSQHSSSGSTDQADQNITSLDQDQPAEERKGQENIAHGSIPLFPLPEAATSDSTKDFSGTSPHLAFQHRRDELINIVQPAVDGPSKNTRKTSSI